MSELKGQLLGMLMVMVLFTSVTLGLVQSFKDNASTIETRAGEETTFVNNN